MIRITKAHLSWAAISIVAAFPLITRFPLTPLIPLLVYLFYRLPYDWSLWTSCGAGLLLDLLNSDTHFGLYTLTYTLTTAALYHQQKHFFQTSLTTLPSLTAIYSSGSTLLLFLLKKGFGEGLPVTFGWIATDLLILPLVDGVYVLLVAALPLWLLHHGPRIERPYRMPRPK